MGSPKPPKKFEFGDLKVRPLVARKRPARVPEDQWYWQILCYKDGKQNVSWSGWATRADVAERAARLVVEHQGAPGGQRSVDPSDLTVKDLLEFFGAAAATWDQSPRTLFLMRRNRGFLEATIGSVRLTRLDVAVMDSYVAARRGKAAPLVIGNEIGTLSKAWHWGRPRGLTPDKSFPRPQNFRPKAVSDGYTPPAEDIIAVIERMWDRGGKQGVRQSSGAHGSWVKRALIIQAGSGMRIGEVCSMRWEEIDLRLGVFRMRGGKDSKGRKTGGRVVALSETALAELLRTPEAEREGHVLPCDGVRATMPGTVGTVLKQSCEIAGVTPFTSHGIRRRVENDWIDAGVDIRTFASQFGHSPQTALKHYAKATDQGKARAAKMVDVMRAGRVGGTVIQFPGANARPDQST